MYVYSCVCVGRKQLYERNACVSVSGGNVDSIEVNSEIEEVDCRGGDT